VDQASGPGRDPEPRSHDEDARQRLTAADRLLDRKLDQWASRSPWAGNVAAVGLTALLMVWILVGSRDLPDRASVLSTIGAFMGCCHLAAHMFIFTGLKKLNRRGIAAADRALKSYLGRVTQRDVAIAWGLFALIAWL
jgi:hypothetical protein